MIRETEKQWRNRQALTGLTFAIGDIHGCRDKLERLMEHCANYADKRLFRYIALGDYIDRGPDSASVVRLMECLSTQKPDGILCLKGNHEDMLLGCLESPLDVGWWLDNGGDATLQSYGAKWPTEIPANHIEWMKKLPFFHDDGLRFFVHAGVDPTLPLDAQSEETMLWTREPYPETMNPGRFIVHGHTPLKSGVPLLHPYRLNLDTAACLGGPLTAAVFDHRQASPLAFITDAGTVTEIVRVAVQL